MRTTSVNFRQATPFLSDDAGREQMENRIILFVALMLCASASPQEQSRQLRGGGHLLGESAEQFFSEGFVGEVLRACQAKHWKTVSSKVGPVSKSLAKDY